MSHTCHFCYKLAKLDFVSKEGKKRVLPGFEYAIWEEFLDRGIMLRWP